MTSFDLQPTLEGQTLLLRPLRNTDFEALHAAASDPLIWQQHPSPDRYQLPVFEKFFKDGLASGGALAIIDREKDQMIGSSRYYDLDEGAREVAIGFTFLSRAYWGGKTNGEMKKLMLDHAFRSLNAVWFHVGPNNMRSQKALQKIGAEFSHRGIKELAGQAVDYVFYKLTREQFHPA
jgi:RimJ/RimL family protein N-acetyltransferase